MHRLRVAGFTPVCSTTVFPMFWAWEGDVKTVFIADGTRPLEVCAAASEVLTLEERNAIRSCYHLPPVCHGMPLYAQVVTTKAFRAKNIPASLRGSVTVAA